MVTGNNFVISDNALQRENLSSHGIDTFNGNSYNTVSQSEDWIF